jgi:hypothetical protein
MRLRFLWCTDICAAVFCSLRIPPPANMFCTIGCSSQEVDPALPSFVEHSLNLGIGPIGVSETPSSVYWIAVKKSMMIMRANIIIILFYSIINPSIHQLNYTTRSECG